MFLAKTLLVVSQFDVGEHVGNICGCSSDVADNINAIEAQKTPQSGPKLMF